MEPVTKLELIVQRAKAEPKMCFTSLAHLLDEEYLKQCYHELKKGKACGVDGVSVEEYGRSLDSNLSGLVERMKGRKYYPQPVRRVYIPKSNGSQRPLGILAVEDKVVQQGMSKILQAVFEGDFLNVSHGFRPKRGCHSALKAVEYAITRPVSFVIEVDIKGYFDHVNHKWLMECLRQRINDPRFLSLVWRNLRAGVCEEGRTTATEMGTPQGGVISPILSNIFLHYVLDLWFEKKLKKEIRGYAEMIRYCDDFIICVQTYEEAHKILDEVKKRLAKFGLEVSPEKTRIVRFGRYARKNAQSQGRKPETFDFLGFTHYCDTDDSGVFRAGRRTCKKRLRAKLKDMNVWLKRVRSKPIKEWWPVLKSKLSGHYQYYGISRNSWSIRAYHYWTMKLVFKWLNERSQRKSYTWEKFNRYLQHYPLPSPRVTQNFYAQTMAV